MTQAVTLYQSFREKAPQKLITMPVKIPRVVACMGHVEAIDYRTTHGRKVTLYRHKFEAGSRPLLCVSGDGKQLMLLGGRYEWTDRGIQDEDATGKLIDNPKHGQNINPRRASNPSWHQKRAGALKFSAAEYTVITDGGASGAGHMLFKSLRAAKSYASKVRKLYPGMSIQIVAPKPRRNPAKPKAAHHCPICKKAGGSHLPDALRTLGYSEEYAHPRCIEKKFSKSRVIAPAKAHIHKGVYYFETHDDAKQYALAHGYPITRIVAYQRGWAIQGGVSGDYAGPHGLKVGNWRHKNPVRDPAHKKLLKGLAQHFASDEKALRKNARRTWRSKNPNPQMAGYEDGLAGLVSYAMKYPVGQRVAYSDGYIEGARERRNQVFNAPRGNPKSPAHKLTQRQFAAYVRAFRPSRALQRKAVALYRSDMVGWTRAGLHRLFQAVEST